jgi:hypothetical protein
MKPEWAMVILTSIYVGATIFYACVSFRMLGSIEKSAEAALNNANAVINSERAWLVVEPVDRNPGVMYDGTVTPRDKQQNVVGISIKNFGRTPARVIHSCLIYVRVDSLKTLPDVPQYLDITTHQGLTIVPNGEPIGHVAYLRPSSHLAPKEATAVINQESFLYAYGFVEYADTVGGDKHHFTRFGYVYNIPQGGQPQFLTGLMPGGPPAYNETT